MGDKVQAHRDAVARYAQSRKAFTIRLEPGEYADIVNAAAMAGMSIRAYMLGAIRERMERDAATEQVPESERAMEQEGEKTHE